MSSLRVESLRLVWLEAFLEVTAAENISAAAKAMNVDQSTVSRYMKALEKWAGKSLLKLEPVKDEKAGPMTRMTDDGIELLGIVQELVPKLLAFRAGEARRNELLEDLAAMIDTMVVDLESGNSSQTVEALRDDAEFQAIAYPQLLEAPIEVIEPFALAARLTFKCYERELKRERRLNREKAKPRNSARFISVPTSPAD